MILPACGTGSSRRNDDHATTGIPPATNSFPDGTIAYRNPKPQVKHPKAQPITLILTSSPHETSRIKYEADMVVSADTIREDGQRTTDRRLVQKIFGDLEAKPKNVSAKRLGAIWSALVRDGILSFPLHHAASPPRDIPSIILIQGGEQWIFKKYDKRILSLGPEEQTELLGSWRSCYFTIVRAFDS